MFYYIAHLLPTRILFLAHLASYARRCCCRRDLELADLRGMNSKSCISSKQLQV